MIVEPLFAAIPRNVEVAETEFVNTFFGVHPSFVAITYDWIVAVGVTKITSVSAPDLASVAICCSGDGEFTSNGCAETICDVCDPRPALKPLR